MTVLAAAVRERLLIGTLAAVLVLAGCATSPRVCRPVSFSPAADARYTTERRTLGFAPTLPCSFRSDLQIARVLIAPFPATPPTQRISFVVEQRGKRAFILSATTAEVPFTAIPQGTGRLSASGNAAAAAGFFGPSGGGDEIAYLRWRVAGVTYELSAILGPSLTHRDVQAIAIAMIDAGSADAATGAG